MGNKKCNKCQKVKEYSEFAKNIKTSLGIENKCKECYKKYYIQNREKILIRTKGYDVKNSKNRKSYREQYVVKHKTKLNSQSRERYNNDIEYQIKNKLRVRIYNAIKGTIKSNTTIHLLGCTIQKLKCYLESQFKPEMNWDNYGPVWEIDHIKPCSSFDLTNIKQQKQCFHYTNLQPLFKTTRIAEKFGYINQVGNRNKSNLI